MNISFDQTHKYSNEIAIVTKTLRFQYCERRIAIFHAKLQHFADGMHFRKQLHLQVRLQVRINAHAAAISNLHLPEAVRCIT